MVEYENGAYQAKGFQDVLAVVKDMSGGDSRLIRLANVPKGQVPDCGRLVSDLDDQGFRTAVMQEDTRMMPDYITVLRR